MDKKIMKKWVKALRSGKYAKTRGKLCNVAKNGNKSYCCLGVLTDLYNKEHTHKECLTGSFLSDQVCKWAKVSTTRGIIAGYGHYFGKDLVDLNDCDLNKRSFKRIADIIENNWEWL